MTVPNEQIKPFVEKFYASHDWDALLMEGHENQGHYATKEWHQAIAESGDWAVWAVLADFFADHDDHIGQRWALWVQQTKRVPMRVLGGFKSTGERLYYWRRNIHNSSNEDHATPHCASALLSVALLPKPSSTHNSGVIQYESFVDCYLYLLRAYREVAVYCVEIGMIDPS